MNFDLIRLGGCCLLRNGVSFLRLCCSVTPSVMFYTDASGSWGGVSLSGVLTGCNSWPPKWDGISIMVKELVPIVLAAAVWGASWANSMSYVDVTICQFSS